MNEQNFDYLKNQLKYTGFGEELQPDLREKILSGQPHFILIHRAEFGKDRTESVLHFNKSEQNEMYFFNRYFLSLINDQNESSFTQSFYPGQDNNITLKEAYNLMNGRAIHKEITTKEGKNYRAWLQLNFNETAESGEFKMKQFHPNYGFGLRQTLVKYPIKELEHVESSQSLIRSLERGNRQLVTFIIEGWEQKMFIEANPQFKTLNIYTSDLLRVNRQLQIEPERKDIGERPDLGPSDPGKDSELSELKEGKIEQTAQKQSKGSRQSKRQSGLLS
jgi:hypothetical protein